jgi:hypothetical protein
MGTQRTSNKDVLDAIQSQTASIDALVTALTAGALAPAAASPSSTEQDAPVTEETTVEVDGAYLSHMTEKAKAHAKDKGETVVLYARRNGRGETKLAYALQERYDSVVSKQPSCLGSQASFTAS